MIPARRRMSESDAARIVSQQSVTLAGAGPLREVDLDEASELAPRLVAADSGADRLIGLGHTPEAVIGDMDSLGDAARDALAPQTLHRVDEQDSTDFEKCLTRIEAPLVLAIGVTGGRLDHTLAAFNTLLRHPVRRCILIGAQDVVTLCPAMLELPLAAGTRVSLFPFGPVTAQSEGLKWPLDGIRFAPDGTIATSNAATGPLRLGVDTPRLILILPRAELRPLIAALETAPRWTR